MRKNQVAYVHNLTAHNLDSPKVIVPMVIEYLRPKSVVDVGCGIGTFLKVFNDHGVNDFLGLDGNWVNKELLTKNIDLNNFLEVDLQEDFSHLINRKFDLVVTLEVIEHLNSESEDKFLKNLTSLGDKILFSGATLNQGGQNHLNEKPLSYWVKKFESLGFVCHDVFRREIWNNPNVQYWYKQNIVLFSKANLQLETYDTKMLDIIHPELLIFKETLINNLVKGKLSPMAYLKFFIKSLLKTSTR